MIRGSTITFTATCLDASGAAVSPDTATLYLVYAPADGGHTRTRQSVPMSVQGATVQGKWDSSVASAAMPVIWHIRAGETAVDGSFRLEAAEANPAKERAT